MSLNIFGCPETPQETEQSNPSEMRLQLTALSPSCPQVSSGLCFWLHRSPANSCWPLIHKLAALGKNETIHTGTPSVTRVKRAACRASHHRCSVYVTGNCALRCKGLFPLSILPTSQVICFKMTAQLSESTTAQALRAPAAWRSQCSDLQNPFWAMPFVPYSFKVADFVGTWYSYKSRAANQPRPSQPLHWRPLPIHLCRLLVTAPFIILSLAARGKKQGQLRGKQL